MEGKRRKGVGKKGRGSEEGKDGRVDKGEATRTKGGEWD